MTRPRPSDLPPYTGTLTPEQLAVVHAERDCWLRVGLSTTRVDRPAAEAAVGRAYQAAGLAPPSIVVWMESPLGGCLATATLHLLRAQLGDRLDGEPLWRLLKRDLWHQLLGQLDDDQLLILLQRELDDQVEWQVGNLLRGQLSDPLYDQVYDQFEDQLKSRFVGEPGDPRWDPLRRQLDDQLGARPVERLWGQLQRQVHDQLGARFWDELWDYLENWADPWSGTSWLAADRCVRRIAGLAPSPLLEALADAVADAVAQLGWWWPLRDAAVLTERPTILARDEQGRLHAEHGPALAWADGYTLHAVHGVRVPAQVVEAPETITVDQIQAEGNVEVRRVMLERYGHARFLRDTGAEQVHTDDTGTLWRCPMPGDEDLVMVEVHDATPEPDGTRRAYWLRVPSDVRTARQAVAWTFGLARATTTRRRRHDPPE